MEYCAIDAVAECKYAPALRTIAMFMYGDEAYWSTVADMLNANVSTRKKFSAVLRMAARDTLEIERSAWDDDDDMIRATINNILFDMDMMGNT